MLILPRVFTENYPIFRIHGRYPRKGLNPVSHSSYGIAAGLKCLLYAYSAAYDMCARLFAYTYQAGQRGSVRQEIIYYKNIVIRSEDLLGYRNIICQTLGEGYDLGRVEVITYIAAQCLLGKHSRTVEGLGRKARHSYPGRLYRENLVDSQPVEQALPFLAHLLIQFHIHLMVEKAVYLQDIRIYDHSVLPDPILQHFHKTSSLTMFYL